MAHVQSEQCRSHIIEVEPECCIYRVHKKLRKVNEDAYTPKLISIGPFHHKRKNLKKMEELKERYFQEACVRTKMSREDLEGHINKEIGYQKIFHCYEKGSIYMNGEDFMKMILSDSIFIIEQLWRTNENLPKKRTEIISQKCEWNLDACVITCQRETKEDEPEERNPKENIPWLSYNIMQDLILLENQVPFFVLEKLYNFAYRGLPMNQQNEDKSFLKLVHGYFFHFWERSSLIRSSDYEKIFIFSGKEKEVKHFTDFLRYFLLPQDPKRGKSFDPIPCATKLSEAGVEFKGSRVSDSKTERLLDIHFQKITLLKICPFLDISWLMSCFPCFRHFKCLERMQAVLKLKSFIIGDATECAVRNLMALEQYHYPRDAYICNFIILLDNLINTEADVDLLVEKNVIVNWLGNNEDAAKLINKLRQQIVEGNYSCYSELSKQIEDHYTSGWSKLFASFTALYFKDFWRGTATVFGLIALFFSFWSFLKPFVFPS